jgi:GT2 family glycosyltransferase/exo-beta-1,3-glucanase (GH17 family)
MSEKMLSNLTKINVDGKFFRIGSEKFYIKGLSYGPFPTSPQFGMFKSPEQTRNDFQLIKETGANLIKIYAPPEKWFLDLAHEFGLKVFFDIPWKKQTCFLASPELIKETRDTILQAVKNCAQHPAIFAVSIGSEIPSDIIRWHGVDKVESFLNHIIRDIKNIAPDLLCTYTNFPTTEYLNLEEVDFLCFNVYLHTQDALENYLARLQTLAGNKPLVIGECGIDSIRLTEQTQAQMLSWQIETAFRNGTAGLVIFSFCDEWAVDGELITDWAFGIVDAHRKPKPAFESVKDGFTQAPYFPIQNAPLVSVVVACYNGANTLRQCLESLTHLNYPNYEVILVDDGSTDATKDIAIEFPNVRYIRHQLNLGLSTARNTGIKAAKGTIVAFTDADCKADQDWLYYTVQDLIKHNYAGIGGHNFLPPDDSAFAAVVMAAPGGPAPVLLSDKIAEHIPGCNMLFHKWALESIGGFDPQFKRAGDDVDICWRLRHAGFTIGFNHAGFVWHYRRSSITEYLKQQAGYGEAEALLINKHPEKYNWFGGCTWQGKIYGQYFKHLPTIRNKIYHGKFGSSLFQSIYSSNPTLDLMLFTSLEYHALITFPLFVLSSVFHPLFTLAIASLLVSLSAAASAAVNCSIPQAKKRFWSKPLVFFLFLIQPIRRGFARYQTQIFFKPVQIETLETINSISIKGHESAFRELSYFSDQKIDKFKFLDNLELKLNKRNFIIKSDLGWNNFDFEILGSRWCLIRILLISDSGKIIRCRLIPMLTMPARILLSSVIAASVLVIGILQLGFWTWLIPIVASTSLILWFRKKQNSLLRVMKTFIDETAKQFNMTPIQTEKVPH